MVSRATIIICKMIRKMSRGGRERKKERERPGEKGEYKTYLIFLSDFELTCFFFLIFNIFNSDFSNGRSVI